MTRSGHGAAAFTSARSKSSPFCRAAFIEWWLDADASDARYLVSPLDAPDINHPTRRFQIADDRRTLASRVRQLLSRITWVENPRIRARAS
jgi:hypothetical protein